MSQPTSPFLLLVAALSGWLGREHQKVIESLREENRILRVLTAFRNRGILALAALFL